MKKIFSIVFLLAVMALYACTKISSETEHSEITFSVVEELQGRVVALDSVMFRYPYRLEAYGDRVVIEDLHGPDHFYHLFTYPDFRYLSSDIGKLFGKQISESDFSVGIKTAGYNTAVA